MSDWASVQRAVAAALADERDAAAATRWIEGDPAQVQARLSIYRANIAAGAARALAQAYPVLRQVVGGDFFDAMARLYQRRHASASGDLQAYGGALADFIAGFEPAAGLPYLADLARLEWAVHLAGGAADARPWDAAALATLAPDRLGAVRLRFAPGSALLSSRHPVVSVWQRHQPGDVGAFEVDWRRAETAWVARHGMSVEVTAVRRGEAAFLGQALAGRSFAEAFEQADLVEPGFDPGPLLVQLATAHVLTEVVPGG